MVILLRGYRNLNEPFVRRTNLPTGRTVLLTPQPLDLIISLPRSGASIEEYPLTAEIQIIFEGMTTLQPHPQLWI